MKMNNGTANSDVMEGDGTADAAVGVAINLDRTPTIGPSVPDSLVAATSSRSAARLLATAMPWYMALLNARSLNAVDQRTLYVVMVGVLRDEAGNASLGMRRVLSPRSSWRAVGRRKSESG